MLVEYSHDVTARVLLLRLSVEHLARRAQVVALRYQLIHLLSTLKHALHGLMQHLLRSVELVLDLQDLVRLLRVLVLCNVVLELGVGKRVGGGTADGGLGVLCGELVAQLLQDAGDDEVGVFLVRDYDTAQPSRVVVRVDEVVWDLVLLDGKSLACWSPVRRCLYEEAQLRMC